MKEGTAILNNLIVAIQDGDGEILTSQSYEEFHNGKRDIKILNFYLGNKLFKILVDDLGVIRYDDNRLTLKMIIENDINCSAMKLLGKVAEAVIVTNCNNDENTNKKWLSIARKVRTTKDTANNFMAYGTGLLPTQKLFPTKYNPTDPQRDIIWLTPNGVPALMKNSIKTSGQIAGLQLKVSRNGITYLFNDLLNKRYEVPVVYFDIQNDFNRIVQKLYEYNSGCIIGEDFIQASAIDYSSYDEVMFYVDLIYALVRGEITPDYLISATDSNLRSALLSTSLSQINIDTIIS